MTMCLQLATVIWVPSNTPGHPVEVVHLGSGMNRTERRKQAHGRNGQLLYRGAYRAHD